MNRQTELANLRIDRTARPPARKSSRGPRYAVGILLISGLLAAAAYTYRSFARTREVEAARVRLIRGGPDAAETVLSATGYLAAAHKIEVASKVVGRVAWVGVNKGDRVKQGQVLVRLEDDEYRAHLMEARGMVAALRARLAELEHGSLPQEIARAEAEVAQGRADAGNASATLARIRDLATEGVLSRQELDDARAQFERRQASVRALEETLELVRMGPRIEQIDTLRAQLEQARGTLAYAEVQVENTVIKAPIRGTVLERNVEKGEFVTTGFVGDRGAKGYVVSLADLSDLQVELDISQNDFAKLSPRERATVTTDAYPDRKYDGRIEEVSPEANRQKATIQVKVKVLNPDDYLRPDMNASVTFQGSGRATAKIVVPAAALRGRTVFVISDGKAVRRTVRTGSRTPDGVVVEEGLRGGETVVLKPPEDLNDGTKVKVGHERDRN